MGEFFFFSFTHLPMMRLLSVLLLVFCFSAVFAESGARLIISRAILNEELIVGKDTVVNVEIYNVGDEPAFDIEYTEFGAFEQFEPVVGVSTGATWPKLAPGNKISHNFVVKPKAAGSFVVGNAEVTYRDHSVSADTRVVRIVDRMEYPVVLFSEYQRMTAPHVKEWLIFGGLLLVPLALPLSSWYLYQVSYHHGVKKGSAMHTAMSKTKKK